MTTPNAKPRAGEHERTTQYYACEHGIPGGCQFCNATKHQGLEAERDALAAQNRELVEALRWILPLGQVFLSAAPSHPDRAKLETARALLAKHGR